MAEIPNMMMIRVLLHQANQIIPNLDVAELAQIRARLNEMAQRTAEHLEREHQMNAIQNRRRQTCWFIPLRTFQTRAIPAPTPTEPRKRTIATQTHMDEYAPCPTVEQMHFIRQLQQANEQLVQANNEKDETIHRLRQQLDTPPDTPPDTPRVQSASVVAATPPPRATPRDTKLKPRSQICLKWQCGEFCGERTCWYAHGPQFLGTMPSPQG